MKPGESSKQILLSSSAESCSSVTPLCNANSLDAAGSQEKSRYTGAEEKEETLTANRAGPKFNMIPQPQIARSIQKRRSAIGPCALTLMMSTYGKHFAAYCKNRKQPVQQRVSAAVWREVYKEHLDAEKANSAIDGAAFDINALALRAKPSNCISRRFG